MSEPTPADPIESMSLSEHEQTYVHPESAPATEPQPAPVPEPVAEPAAEPEDKPVSERTDGERDEHGRFKPKEKHRAKSQHATAADVPRIAELTKKLREAERKAEELEAKMKAPKPEPVKVPEPPKPFDAKEPKYEDFADAPDQYEAYILAKAEYAREKKGFEQQKTEHETAAKQAMEARNKQRDEWFQARYKAHGERMTAFFAKNPQAEAIIEKADVSLNPVMLAALLASENSDEITLKLAQDSDLVDDLHLLTDDKHPSTELVAYVQRRMTRGLKVANTGSTAPAPVVPALPRPPNPVRTGVMKPADALPGEDAPLSEHERVYGSGGRRRR